MNKVIPIRLSHAKFSEYASLAAAADTPLSTYLRRRLEEGDDTAAEISRLRTAIADALEELVEKSGHRAEQVTVPTQLNESVLVELLMLVRCIAGPSHRRVVAGEMERLGFSLPNEGQLT